MTWENPRTPEERNKARVETARKRLNGVLAAMTYNDSFNKAQKFAIFVGPNKQLWKIYDHVELESHLASDDLLLAALGNIKGTLELTLIPVTGVIEAYL